MEPNKESICPHLEVVIDVVGIPVHEVAILRHRAAVSMNPPNPRKLSRNHAFPAQNGVSQFRSAHWLLLPRHSRLGTAVVYP